MIKNDTLNSNDVLKEWTDLRAYIEAYTKTDKTELSLELPKPNIEQPSRLNLLCKVFNLSLFERRLLLLCFGAAIDPNFQNLSITTLQDNKQKYTYVTLKSALRLFKGSLSVLNYSNPLRHLRLIEFTNINTNIIDCPIYLTDWTLLYLTGYNGFEEALNICLHRIEVAQPILTSEQTMANLILENMQARNDRRAIIQLIDPFKAASKQVAALVAYQYKRPSYYLDLNNLPNHMMELSEYSKLILRQLLIDQAICLVNCDYLLENLTNCYPIKLMLEQLVHCLPFNIILTSHKPGVALDISLRFFNLSAPNYAERVLLWQSLGNPCLPQTINYQSLARNFKLTRKQITSILSLNFYKKVEVAEIEASLWQHCCEEIVGQSLSGLVEWIEPKTSIEALEFSDKELGLLHNIIDQLQYSEPSDLDKHYPAKDEPAKTIKALFGGLETKQKIIAAEAIANKLKFNLLYVKLDAVMTNNLDKTQTNLALIFAAAEQANAILLINETEILFGPYASEDPFNKINKKLILQHMNLYQGLVILATNTFCNVQMILQDHFHFCLKFNLSDKRQRMQLWQQACRDTKFAVDLNYELLSDIPLTYQQINDIALQVAFRSAKQPIDTHSILVFVIHRMMVNGLRIPKYLKSQCDNLL